MDDIFDFLDSEPTEKEKVITPEQNVEDLKNEEVSPLINTPIKNENHQEQNQVEEEVVEEKKEINQIEEKKIIEKKEDPEPSQPINNTCPMFKLQKNLHPINFIDYIEKNFSVFFTLNPAGSLFELSNYKNNSNIKYSLLDKKSQDSIKEKIENGRAKSIISAGKEIFIGEYQGLINIFNIDTGEFNGKLYFDDVAVTAMDINQNGNWLIAGFSNGQIALWDLANKDKPNIIIKDKHASPVVAIKYAVIEPSLNKIVVISSDGDGNVLQLKIEKSFLMKRIREFPIYKEKNVTFLIETFKPDKARNVVLAALGTLESIKIFLVEPTISMIQEIKKFSGLRNEIVPDVCFGYGYLPFLTIYGNTPNQDLMEQDDKSLKILCVICWDKLIKFYSIRLEHESVYLENNGNESGFFESQCPIIRMGNLSNSVFYFFDTLRQVKVLNSSLVFPGEYSTDYKFKVKNYYTQSLLEEGSVIDPDLYCDNISKSLKDKINFYRNTIMSANKSIYLLCSRNAYRVKLKNYRECFEVLIEREDWLDALCLGLDIYKGNLTSFPDLPTNEEERKNAIKPYLQDLIIAYVNYSTKKDPSETVYTSNEETKKKIKDAYDKKLIHCMNISIEFCISFQAVDFLFTTIMPMFDGLSDKFIQTVEPYIFADKLREDELMTATISSLMMAYGTKKKLCIFAHLLIHLSYDSINNIFVKAICDKYKLFTSMIFLCSNSKSSEENFKPITHMMKYYMEKFNKDSNLKRRNNIPLENDFIEDEEETKGLSYDEIYTQKGLNYLERTRDYIAHKLLWYIDLCLNGKKLCIDFRDNESYDINSIHYKQLIIMIYLWLIKKENFDLLVEFDSYSYFFILTKLFTIDYILNIITEYDYNQVPDFFIEQHKIKLIQPYPYADISKMINEIISMTKESKNNYLILQDLNIFILKIASQHSEGVLMKETVLEAAKGVLLYYKELENIEPENKIDKYNCHGIPDESFDLTCSLEKLPIAVKAYSNELAKTFRIFLTSGFDTTKEDLFELIDYCKITPYLPIRMMLYDMLGLYKDYINEYLTRPEMSKTDMFKWLNKKFIDLNGKKEDIINYNNLKKAYLEESNSLVQINLDEYSKIFEKYFFGDEKDEIINKLDEVPEIKLKFLEKIVKEKIQIFEANSEDSKKDDISHLIFLNFILLHKLGRYDELLPLLEKRINYFTVFEVTKFCEENKIDNCCVFLYTAKGEFEKALNLTLQEIQKCFDLMQEQPDKKEVNFEKFTSILNNCIQICSLNSEQSFTTRANQNDIWFKILSKLYSFQSKLIQDDETAKLVKDNKKEAIEYSSLLKCFISDSIERVLKQVCLFANINLILENVTEYSKDATFKEFKDLLVKMLKSNRKFKLLLSSAKNLLCNSVLYNVNEFKREHTQGHLFSFFKCDYCNKSLFRGNIDEFIFVFNCGHKFHISCGGGEEIEQPICIICKKNELEEHSSIEDNEYVSYFHNYCFRQHKDSLENKQPESIKKTEKLNKLKRMLEEENEKMEIINKYDENEFFDN